MNTIIEDKLIENVDRKIVYRMIELADGFAISINDFVSTTKEVVVYNEVKTNLFYEDIVYSELLFPTLINRAFFGMCQHHLGMLESLTNKYFKVVFHKEKILKEYELENYKVETLSVVECAMLDCLIELINKGY